MLSNLRATAVYPLPLGLPALATLLGACALVVDVEDCRSDAVCGQGRVCVDGTCLTVAPPAVDGGAEADQRLVDALRLGIAAPALPEGCDERLLSPGALLRVRQTGTSAVSTDVVQALAIEDAGQLPRAYDPQARIDLTFEALVRVGDRGDYAFEGTASAAVEQTLELSEQAVAVGAPRALATVRLEPGLHRLVWRLVSVPAVTPSVQLIGGPVGREKRVLAPPAIFTTHTCDGVRSPCEDASDDVIFGRGTCDP